MLINSSTTLTLEANLLGRYPQCNLNKWKAEPQKLSGLQKQLRQEAGRLKMNIYVCVIYTHICIYG